MSSDALIRATKPSASMALATAAGWGRGLFTLVRITMRPGKIEGDADIGVTVGQEMENAGVIVVANAKIDRRMPPVEAHAVLGAFDLS